MLRSSLEQENKLVKLVRHDVKAKQGWSKEGFQVRIEEEDRLLALVTQYTFRGFVNIVL